MTSVWRMYAADSFPTTEAQIDRSITVAAETLPREWLDAGYAVWEDPLFWMIHRPGETFTDEDMRDSQIEIAAELQRQMPGKVPIIVTLTDDPRLEFVVGRLKIVNHEDGSQK